MLPGMSWGSPCHRIVRTIGLLSILGLVACGPQEDGSQAVVAESALEANQPEGLELAEAYPIDAEDLETVLLARGTVLGKPQLDGFFLGTDDDRVLFIKSAQPVTVGQRVRAVGPLRIADLAIFKAWERDLLGDTDATRLIQLFYIDATSVTPV